MFIHSQLTYGLTIWGSTFPSYLKKLKSLQNKAVKFVEGGSLLEKPIKFYNIFSVLKLDNLYKLEVAKIVHACLTNFSYKRKISVHVLPELLKLYAITYIFPDTQLPDFNNASNIKE